MNRLSKIYATCMVLLASFVFSLNTQAQNQIATLNHSGTITAYSGQTALATAYAAAEDGDVITLSGGLFDAVNISKSITLRGAGCQPDPATNRLQTFIQGDFSINNSSTDLITIENIYFSNHTITLLYNTAKVRNLTFSKCRIYKVSNSGSSGSYNISVNNCRVTSIFDTNSSSVGSKISYNNCILRSPDMNSTSACYNCVIYNGVSISSGTFENCVIKFQSTNSTFASACSVTSCVGIDNIPNMFSNCTNTTNKIVSANIFKEGFNIDDENCMFELTDEAKAEYKGIDGREVGIYGGGMPFDLTPEIPTISEFTVSQKTTADGKLSVKIKVSANNNE